MRSLISILIINLALFCPQALFAQDTLRIPRFNIWLEPKVTPEAFPKVNGQLYNLLDRSIVIRYSYVDIYAEPVSEVEKFMEVPVENIDIIKLRRKGAVEETAAIGALAGLTAGIILGYIGTSNYSDASGAFVLGLVCAIPVGLGAGLIASHKTKYNIHRSIHEYSLLRENIPDYLKPQP